MLGGEVGRMRREAWAKDLHAGAKSDRKLAAALREVDTAEPKAAQVDALLRAFFVDDGAGDAKGTETRDIVTKAVGQRIPSLLIGLRREQESPHRFARAPARRDGARAQRRPVRSRDGDPFNLRADEGRARRARFRRPDRPRARASDPLERRLGAAQARLWSRSPAARRSPGRLSATMGNSGEAHRGILRRRRRARLEPHRVCGRRREAVHLRLSRRGARDAGRDEARCSPSAIATPSARSPTFC